MIEASGAAEGTAGHVPHSYKIPITLPAWPSRKHIGGVALHGSAKRLSAYKEHPMMDILMLALAFLFFAAAIGYTYACERL